MTADTINACRLADEAAAAGTDAARLWGVLEGSERIAAERWDAASHAFRFLGDHAAADAARDKARWHWNKANRLAVAFMKADAARPKE